MFAHRLQHREHGQVGLAADRLVYLRIGPQHLDRVLGHLIHGVLEHFFDAIHGLTQRLVGAQFRNVWQQSLHRLQLQVVGERLRGRIRSRCEHEGLGTEPA